MNLGNIKKLLEQKESTTLEFKESYNKIPANLFETVCAFLNRDGGDIFLGVKDNGEIQGLDVNKIDDLKADIVNLSNNPQKLDPPFILFPNDSQVEGKTIIHIHVPQSSQVHKTGNNIYDRSNDGDFRVTSPGKIAELHNRKKALYTEATVYPYLSFGDFKKELFVKTRNLIRSKTPAHPWLSLTDEEIMVKAGLIKKDYFTGNEGYTLAAALLFGKDEVIRAILPYYQIDALVRRENTDRYDDRLIIQSNLIEAYDLLMDFTAKHLPDKFYLEGDIRISLRDRIFREVIANLIVHREYMNAYPATFIIHREAVIVQNANVPHGKGPLQLDSFTPFPKNPNISAFFMQLGRFDKIGSGIINTTKYLEKYAPGRQPEFFEDDIFKTVIPLVPVYWPQVTFYNQHIKQKFKYLDFTGLNLFTYKPLLLEDLYITLNLTRSTGKPGEEISGSHPVDTADFVSLFSGLFEDCKKRGESLKMVIQGQPGSGKTTLLKWIALQCASPGENGKSVFSPLVPVFIPLRNLDWASDSPSRGSNLLDLTLETWKRENITDSFLREYFEENRVIFLLDGLDEIADENLRRQIIQWIENQDLRRNTLLITSRIAGLQAAKGLKFHDSFPVFQIQDFHIKDIEQFLVNWYRSVESIIPDETGKKTSEATPGNGETRCADFMRIITGENNINLFHLAANPLLLTVMAIMHRNRGLIPGELDKLYEECLNVMIERWNVANKRINITFSADESLAALSTLAAALMKEKRYEIELSQIHRLMPAEIDGKPLDVFLKEMVLTAGLLHESGGNYGFRHFVFMEYLGRRGKKKK